MGVSGRSHIVLRLMKGTAEELDIRIPGLCDLNVGVRVFLELLVQ